MKILKLSIIAIALLVLGISASACSIPGTEGHGRYKTELLSTLAAIENDIATKGEIQEKNVQKLREVLTKWEEDFGTKGSYIRAKESLEQCEKSVAAAEGTDVFMTNQNIKLTNDAIRSYMQTEGD
jgi:maltose-binding protein MalE